MLPLSLEDLAKTSENWSFQKACVSDFRRDTGAAITSAAQQGSAVFWRGTFQGAEGHVLRLLPKLQQRQPSTGKPSWCWVERQVLTCCVILRQRNCRQCWGCLWAQLLLRSAGLWRTGGPYSGFRIPFVSNFRNNSTVPVVCTGVSAAFAVKLFKSWINEKDINAVAVSLRKVNMDNRLMVSTTQMTALLLKPL